MADEVGLVTMAGARATQTAPEIGIGMLGYAFMGKAHTNAYKKLPYMIYPPPAVPKLVAIAGRDEAAVPKTAPRCNYLNYYTNWGRMLSRSHGRLVVNCGLNNFTSDACHDAAPAGE